MNWKRWNKHDKVWSRTNSFLKWRFRGSHHFCCLSSLLRFMCSCRNTISPEFLTYLYLYCTLLLNMWCVDIILLVSSYMTIACIFTCMRRLPLSQNSENFAPTPLSLMVKVMHLTKIPSENFGLHFEIYIWYLTLFQIQSVIKQVICKSLTIMPLCNVPNWVFLSNAINGLKFFLPIFWITHFFCWWLPTNPSIWLAWKCVSTLGSTYIKWASWVS